MFTGVSRVVPEYDSIEDHRICFRVGTYFMAAVLAAASYSRGGFILCLAGNARCVMVPGGNTFTWNLEQYTLAGTYWYRMSLMISVFTENCILLD